MVADGFSLTLTCYNLELAITITIEANVRTPRECVLNAKLLGDMVRRMPSGEVELALNDNGTVEIRGGTAKFELTALNLNDFPTLPNPGATPHADPQGQRAARDDQQDHLRRQPGRQKTGAHR